MEKMKRFKRRLSQTLRGSHTIDESLSELAEHITIEENGLKDNGEPIISSYMQFLWIDSRIICSLLHYLHYLSGVFLFFILR